MFSFLWWRRQNLVWVWHWAWYGRTFGLASLVQILLHPQHLRIRCTCGGPGLACATSARHQHLNLNTWIFVVFFMRCTCDAYVYVCMHMCPYAMQQCIGIYCSLYMQVYKCKCRTGQPGRSQLQSDFSQAEKVFRPTSSSRFRDELDELTSHWEREGTTMPQVGMSILVISWHDTIAASQRLSIAMAFSYSSGVLSCQRNQRTRSSKSLFMTEMIQKKWEKDVSVASSDSADIESQSFLHDAAHQPMDFQCKRHRLCSLSLQLYRAGQQLIT